MPRGKNVAREWALLLLLALVWGSAFVFYKLLDNAGVPPITIVAGRVGIAALAMLAFLATTRRALPRSPELWRAFIVMGLFNNLIPFALIAYGETRIASALAAILNATTPIFTLLVARVAAHERLTANKLVGIALGFVGVAIVVGPDALAGLDLRSSGQVACLAAAVSYGCAAVYGRRFAKVGLDPTVAATGQLCGSSLLAFPLALAVEQPWTHLAQPAGIWGAWIALALLCTSFAFAIYFRLIETLGAVNATLVTMLVPVSALALGIVTLGERPHPASIAGMVVIALALVVIDGRLLAYVRNRRSASTVPCPLRSRHDVSLSSHR